MADSTTSVALNIGSQRVSMAVFDTAKNGGLVLKSYGSESISGDPAMDASRLSQTRVAIADLANRLKVGKTKVRYALSGQSVITRFVKLPPIDVENIEQLVKLEAQQHIPFPINEVVWDYELVHGSAEKEVVIAAIKADALEEINSAVHDAGLGTAEVDVSPLALFNAFRASYGELSEPVLLIDIGGKTSDLIFIEGARFYTRSVQIGGSTISAAIAKEYGIPFADAEHQKEVNGLVALGGGHTDGMDESIAALAMVIRNAMTRLTADAMRTTNFYRSQHGGTAPQKVYIAGGGANLPYTLEFFQEKLNLPVEFFNPLRGVAMGKNIDTELVQREALMMGELIGLGLRGVGKSSVNIDLVPGVVEQERAADKRKPFLIAAAAILIVGCAAWAGLQSMAASKASAEAKNMEDSRDVLRPVAGQISSLLRTEDSLTSAAQRYVAITNDQSFWPDVYAQLTAAFASDVVWVVDFEPLANYDPLPTDPKATKFVPVVKSDFLTVPYGATSLTDIKPVENLEQPRSRRNQPAPTTEPMTNGIRIRGLWRANPAGGNVVSDIVAKLRENPGAFTFTVKNADGTEVVLKDEQILNVTVAQTDAVELALPFDLTLPLARPVPTK